MDNQRLDLFTSRFERDRMRVLALLMGMTPEQRAEVFARIRQKWHSCGGPTPCHCENDE